MMWLCTYIYDILQYTHCVYTYVFINWLGHRELYRLGEVDGAISSLFGMNGTYHLGIQTSGWGGSQNMVPQTIHFPLIIGNVGWCGNLQIITFSKSKRHVIKSQESTWTSKSRRKNPQRLNRFSSLYARVSRVWWSQQLYQQVYHS
jgi:hypothetical protein